MKSIIKEIKEYYKEYHWDRYNSSLIGGMGEDNNMTAYKYDILSTRYRFKKIAEYKGFQKPFRFKRQDFRWERSDYHSSYRLLGKLVLTDKVGNTLISRDLEWLYYEDPDLFFKLNHEFLGNDKWFKKELYRYKIMKQNLTRLGVLDGRKDNRSE